MGTSGTRATSEGAAARERHLERLAPLSPTAKSMFGGHGLFADGAMFAMVTSDGALALKGDDSTRELYEGGGAERRGKMPYWRVPDAVLDDAETLLAWARRAVDLAQGR